MTSPETNADGTHKPFPAKYAELRNPLDRGTMGPEWIAAQVARADRHAQNTIGVVE